MLNMVGPELNNQWKPVFGSGYRLNPDHLLNRGLVAWWLMNEGSGVNTYDTSAYKNPGVLSGTTKPVWTNGPYGTALGFGGAAYINNPSDLIGIDDVTVSAVVNITNTGGNLGLVGNSKFYVLIETGLSRMLISSDGASTNIYPSWNSSTMCGVWAMVTVIRRAGNLYAYYNGTLLSNSGNGGTPARGSATTIGLALLYFQGSIDRTVIYNRALSQSEINQLYIYPFGTPDNPRLLFPSTRRYFVPSGVITFYAAWASQANSAPLGTGIY